MLFPKYHNALNYYPSKILSKHCFHFLLVLTIVPIEIEKYSYVKFWRENKEYFTRLLPTTLSFPSDRTCTCSTSQQPRMGKACGCCVDSTVAASSVNAGLELKSTPSTFDNCFQNCEWFTDDVVIKGQSTT